MQPIASFATCDRENLSDLLTSGGRTAAFRSMSVEALAREPLPPRGIGIGYWDVETGDPFPDFMVVNDEDQADTYAWLSAFLDGLAPITGWCRIWTRTDFRTVAGAGETGRLGSLLGAWVGAILAEVSVQSRAQVDLKELNVTAALTSASFCAARATAVWPEIPHLIEIARRHDDLSSRLRDGARPLPAASLTGLWYVLAGERWSGNPPADERSLTKLRAILRHAVGNEAPPMLRIPATVRLASDEFDLPELADCASGPQARRVDALDRLAAKLGRDPQSTAADALLGLGASLVDPGVSVMPDLLRRTADRFPTAPVWAGAIAGAWSPVRVLSDFGGLGRLIARELLARSDLFTKPGCDIAYDELIRWLPGMNRARVSIRGMVARTLTVELAPGVSTPFALARQGVDRSDAPVTPDSSQRLLSLETSHSRVRATDWSGPSVAELAEFVDVLTRRVAALEAAGASAAASTRRARAKTSERAKPKS